MSEKIFNSRIVHKHAVEADWIKAVNFIPKQGEIIVYDVDANHNYERFKIGDGKTLVSSLPFADDSAKQGVSALGTIVSAVNSRVDSVSALVGDTAVSSQISAAIANKADTGHTHDDRYYTESEINTKLSGKSDTGHNHDAVYAAKSHGNHVPATQTADNAKFLRNDNTWQIVTPANIGAAAESHGTHVTFATTAPKAAGTASVGTATTVSRSDHVHPAQTSITGNAATATKATQDASGNVITSTYATKTELNAVSELVGDTSVSEQIAAANMIYVGPTAPSDPNIKVWINTSEDGTGIVPVLPRVATITLAANAWSGSSEPYSQAVSINTVTSASKIDLQPTAQQIVSLQNAETSFMIENNGGVVTCYAIGNKPTVNYTMQVLIQEVSYV